jgi:hypothetical protein
MPNRQQRLNVLRETVMGRELFDYAFKTYATAGHLNTLHLQICSARWKMHRQLTWIGFGADGFTEPSLLMYLFDSVKYYRLNTKNPAAEGATDRAAV